MRSSTAVGGDRVIFCLGFAIFVFQPQFTFYQNFSGKTIYPIRIRIPFTCHHAAIKPRGALCSLHSTSYPLKCSIGVASVVCDTRLVVNDIERRIASGHRRSAVCWIRRVSYRVNTSQASLDSSSSARVCCLSALCLGATGRDSRSVNLIAAALLSRSYRENNRIDLISVQ
jgi:hypothetical protein